MEIFRNQVVIVTGAASGFGRRISEKLATYGAKIIAADINFEQLQTVVAQIQKNGGQAEAQFLDVRDRDSIDSFIRQTTQKYGRLDYIFNNAGIAMGGETYAMTIADWQKIIDINLWSVIQGTVTAYEIMRAQGSGHIINTASMLGLIPGPLSTAYSVTKHGVYGLSRALRSEGKDWGVKVTAICPGFVKTNLLNTSQMFEMTYEDMMKILPYKVMDLDKAVDVILKGVKNNRDLIVFPFHARFSWWLSRYFRGLLNWGNETIISRYRQTKKTQSKVG
ncbi:MAG: SDR family oxidoreductase [Microscillaceae bacterium]|jgi:NADP-dependent 3-hydroxy acid dehydrogenase YdfG|nr:SDR family oxidoreductase [Microscillaceae bacterium]